MISRLRLSLRRFRRDDRGVVAMMFAIAVIPIMLLVGSVVDYTNAAKVNSRLQAATDATALATARWVTSNPSSTESDALNFARAYFRGAMGIDYAEVSPNVTSVTFERNRSRIVVAAEALYPTIVMQLAQINNVLLTADATVDRGTNYLEVALVLDNTGSMATNDRIGKLRNAATSLVTILEGARTGDRDVKIALVPFVTAVNVRGAGFKWSWIDQNAQAQYHGQNFTQAGGAKVNHLTLFNQIRDPSGNPVAWKGCVEARPAPYDTSDVPPSLATPDTLFVPYLWPDEAEKEVNPTDPTKERNTSGYNNKYLADQAAITDTAAVRQSSITKYNTTNRATVIDDVPGDTFGPNKSCPTPIVPLTSDFNLLRTEIAAMRHWNNSGTNIAEGLAWGERVLSPEEPYTDGRAWNDVNTQKVIILLTDGENVIYGQNSKTQGPTTHNKSDYSSVGYLGKNRLGTDDPDVAKTKLLDKVGQICTSLKQKAGEKDKALVYTITFEIPSTTLRNAFRACATRADMYYDSPSADQLGRVFETIAWELAALRISK
jgi:Flp pilus assembly protein TadG